MVLMYFAYCLEFFPNIFRHLHQFVSHSYYNRIFDKNYLTKLMEDTGLIAIHTWDYKRTSHSKYFDFSQATTWEIPISLNLEGRKG